MNSTARYETALSEFAQAGNRYAKIPELTATGKAAGLSAEDIIADARQVGITDRDGDIRRMFNGSIATSRRSHSGSARRFGKRLHKPPERKTYPDEVKDMIAWGKEIATSKDIMAMSPTPTADLKGIEAARAQIAAMFKPDDLILVGTMKRGVDERNLRRVSDWLTDENLTAWEQVKINPFTGDQAEGGSKGMTRIGERCLARYPLMLLEFDDLTLEDQCRFWAGMIFHEMPVVAIIYSGGKSLHGLIRVGAVDERTWWARCDQAKALYCAAADTAQRADLQAMRPAVAVRLAGAIRGDTKRAQRLLYLDPDAGIARDARKRPLERKDEKTEDCPPEPSEPIVARPDAVYNAAFRCADCPTINDCKTAFGKYWQEKSGYGIGCNRPFAYAKPERKVIWACR